MKNFQLFFGMQLEVLVLMHTGNLFYSAIHTRHVRKLSKLQKYVFQHYKV